MSEHDFSDDAALPVAVAERIDRCCMEFEEAWKEGRQPRIEDFLGSAAGAERTSLLRELLLLEVDYRKRTGARLDAAHYRDRFPDDVGVIEFVFHLQGGGRRARGSPIGEPAGTVTYRSVPLKMRADRYAAQRVHRRGGMGEVWLAHDTEIGRQVAVKRLRRGRDANRERFLAEAQITGQLEHPSIVPVHDLGADEDGQPFYVMKFVEGQTLKAQIAQYHAQRHAPEAQRQLQRLRLLEVFVNVCRAVAYAHSRGVLHRDLKPDNVMLGPYGETLVLDWGLAKVTDQPDILAEGASSGVHLTRSGTSSETQIGSVLGAPPYMSPEVAEGRAAEVDERTDVYLLGAMLYAILTGQPPRRGNSYEEIIELARTVDPSPPRHVKPDVTRALDAVCQVAMSRRPQDRYATALELADDVERYLAGEAVSVLPEGALARAWRWSKRHRVGLLRTAATVFILAMATITFAKVKETRILRLNERADYDVAVIHQLLDAVQFDVYSRGSSFEHVGFDAGRSKEVVQQAGEIVRRWGPLRGRSPVYVSFEPKLAMSWWQMNLCCAQREVPAALRGAGCCALLGCCRLHRSK